MLLRNPILSILILFSFIILGSTPAASDEVAGSQAPASIPSPDIKSAADNTAKEYFERLKKLEAKISVGITYNQYMDALGELKYYDDRYNRETDRLFASEASQPTEAGKRAAILNGYFLDIMLDHQLVAAMWRLSITKRSDYNQFNPKDPEWELFFYRHPEANCDEKAGGILKTSGKRKFYNAKTVMQYRWFEISEKLQSMEKYF